MRRSNTETGCRLGVHRAATPTAAKRSDKLEHMNRRIEYLSLDDLTDNPSNPKSHRVDTITGSIGRFGFVEPIVRDERTGQLISGHGRADTLRSMKDRGDSPPEGVTDTWDVPVMVGWSSRSDAEANAALVAMNRTTELGGWDQEQLLSVLSDLEQNTTDGLEGIGYLEVELKHLAESLETGDDTGTGSSGEVDAKDLQFDHRCPSCGFEFNE